MKKRISLWIIIAITVAWMIPTFAKGDNGFYADESVKLKDAQETTTFVAGNNIDLTSEIDGASFTAGNNIHLSSKQDYAFVAGNNITIENMETKDAFVAGNSITIAESSIRDLYAAGQTIRIDSNISRNAFVAGDFVTINSTIEGNIKIAAEEIRIGKNAVIMGTLEYPKDSKISISESATIEKQKPYKTKNVNVEISWKDLLLNYIYSYLAILLIGFILLYLGKKTFQKIEKEKKDLPSVLKKGIIGLITLIVVPIAAILLMITIIALPLSIITLMLYGILIYLSIIPTAYYFGKWILKDAIKNDYLLLAISILVLKLLAIVPVIGGFILFITIIVGLGIVIEQMTENKQKKN